MKKVSIIGAGNVGATTALKIAESRLADEIVLVDVKEGLARGKALDIAHSSPLLGIRTGRITGTNDYNAIAESDVVVVTAGFTRQPGMVRLDLLKKNAAIISAVAREIKKHAPKGIIINVTNPLDEMTFLLFVGGGLKADRVLGMAGILDSSRMRYFIAEELGMEPGRVEAMVLGGHGESMVPLISLARADKSPVKEKLAPEQIRQIVARTQQAGAEIVSLLGTGSAYYAPGAAAHEMVRAILNDEKKILPCSVYTRGEYGFRGIFLGLPCSLGRQGVEKIVELELSPEEKDMLRGSAELTRRGIEELEKIVDLRAI